MKGETFKVGDRVDVLTLAELKALYPQLRKDFDGNLRVSDGYHGIDLKGIKLLGKRNYYVHIIGTSLMGICPDGGKRWSAMPKWAVRHHVEVWYQGELDL